MQFHLNGFRTGDPAIGELAEGRQRSGRATSSEPTARVAPCVSRSEVAWWSVYEIGQRLCDRFDDAPEAEAARRRSRVFIAGDACHTHSPKAGQGMNVSIADAFNLGWKLAAVVRGTAAPRLLRTYSDERQTIAKELIDFDRAFAKLFSTPSKDPASPDAGGVETAFFDQFMIASNSPAVNVPGLIATVRPFDRLRVTKR